MRTASPPPRRPIEVSLPGPEVLFELLRARLGGGFAACVVPSRGAMDAAIADIRDAAIGSAWPIVAYEPGERPGPAHLVFAAFGEAARSDRARETPGPALGELVEASIDPLVRPREGAREPPGGAAAILALARAIARARPRGTETSIDALRVGTGLLAETPGHPFVHDLVLAALLRSQAVSKATACVAPPFGLEAALEAAVRELDRTYAAGDVGRALLMHSALLQGLRSGGPATQALTRDLRADLDAALAEPRLVAAHPLEARAARQLLEASG
jgi:hypothetical protein